MSSICNTQKQSNMHVVLVGIVKLIEASEKCSVISDFCLCRRECSCILHVRESSRCVPSYALRNRGGWPSQSWEAVRPGDEPWPCRRRRVTRSRRRPQARRCRRSHRQAAAAAEWIPRSCYYHTYFCPHSYPRFEYCVFLIGFYDLRTTVAQIFSWVARICVS